VTRREHRRVVIILPTTGGPNNEFHPRLESLSVNCSRKWIGGKCCESNHRISLPSDLRANLDQLKIILQLDGE
jgi:hypothetical protein